MKSIFVFFILTFSTLLLNAQTKYTVKRKIDGFNREFIVVVPSKNPPIGGYPMVFMLHGTSGDGEKFYNISGWKELGEEENFVTVFPSSLTWCWVEDGVETINTRWVNGNVTDSPCSGPPQNYVDDVKFLKTIVQLIRDTLPINKNKIFASGFSNGSSMIHKLSIDAGDVFSALAGSSAPLAMGDSALPVKRVPTWFMLGTLDDRYFSLPITELPFGRDSMLDYLRPFLNRARVCLGLSDNFIFHGDDSTHVYIYNQSMNGGISSSPYIFSLNKGQTHEFPNGINYPLNAPKLFWEFFKQSSILSINSIEKHITEFKVFPNPSSGLITLNIISSSSSRASLFIYDLLGKIQHKEEIELIEGPQVLKLDQSNLSNGSYVIKIQNKDGYAESKCLEILKD